MAFETSEQGCLICNHPEKMGICVLEKRICLECERGILETDLDDPKYDEYVTSLKNLWFGSWAAYDNQK